METQIAKRLFTVDDYHRMADAGILREDDRVELIRGEILAMSPTGPPHNAAVLRAINTLSRFIGDKPLIGSQGSIRLDKWTEPQPDVYLLKPRKDFYNSRYPGPTDIFLIIEMADSSLHYDQGLKMHVYAETGIVEYWIADIENDRVIRYSELKDKTYGAVHQFHRGETLTPKLLPACRIPVDAVLP